MILSRRVGDFTWSVVVGTRRCPGDRRSCPKFSVLFSQQHHGSVVSDFQIKDSVFLAPCMHDRPHHEVDRSRSSEPRPPTYSRTQELHAQQNLVVVRGMATPVQSGRPSTWLVLVDVILGGGACVESVVSPIVGHLPRRR